MCFSAPKITVPETPTPAPLPPPVEDAPKVEGVDFGGSAETDTETASGVKGEKSKGKSSLKVKREPATTKTGANYTMNRK